MKETKNTLNTIDTFKTDLAEIASIIEKMRNLDHGNNNNQNENQNIGDQTMENAIFQNEVEILKAEIAEYQARQTRMTNFIDSILNTNQNMGDQEMMETTTITNNSETENMESIYNYYIENYKDMRNRLARFARSISYQIKKRDILEDSELFRLYEEYLNNNKFEVGYIFSLETLLRYWATGVPFVQADNFVKCEDCGELINKKYAYYIDCEARYLCQECYDNYNFSHCDICGGTFYDDDLAWIESNEICACKDCIDENYIKCADCGKLMEKGDCGYVYIDCEDHYLCNECYDNSDFTVCDICGAVCYNDDMNWIESEEICTCIHCTDEYFIKCDDCGKWIKRDDAISVDDDYHVVCKHCLQDNYSRCDDCGEYFHIDSLCSIDDFTMVCEHCLENYPICADCNNYCHADDMEYNEATGEWLCPACYEKAQDARIELIRNYHDAPSLIFHKTENDCQKPLYFGVELEVSHFDNTDRLDHAEYCRATLNGDLDNEDNIFLENDCSLQNGFEIISHPRTLNSWHEFSDTIKEYFNNAHSFCVRLRDGLHVHVSKAGMTDAHKIRLGSFMAACQDQIIPIARRQPNSYCMAFKKPKNGSDINKTVSTYDRYQMLNWQNRSTVEFRIFKATLDIIEFYASIEFCHAAYSFTKHGYNASLMEIVKGDCWNKFLEYVRDNKDKYASLIAFLNDLYEKQENVNRNYLSILNKKTRTCKKRG